MPAKIKSAFLKLLTVAAAAGLYAGLFLLFRPYVGDAVMLFSFLPVLAAAVTLDTWVAVFFGLLTFPFNALLLYTAGDLVWGEMLAAGIPSTLGFVILAVFVGRLFGLRKKLDIELSERKKAEELYKTLIEASPDVITMIGLNGVITYASSQNLKVYGYEKPEELVGKNAFDFFAPQDRERVMKDVTDLARGINRGITEYSIVRKDGNLTPVEMSSSVVKDSQGNPSFVVTFIRNIEARKRVERQFLTQKEELERTTKLMIGRELKMAEMKKRVKGGE